MLIDPHCPVDNERQIIFQLHKKAAVTVKCSIFEFFRIIKGSAVNGVEKVKEILFVFAKNECKKCGFVFSVNAFFHVVIHPPLIFVVPAGSG